MNSRAQTKNCCQQVRNSPNSQLADMLGILGPGPSGFADSPSTKALPPRGGPFLAPGAEIQPGRWKGRSKCQATSRPAAKGASHAQNSYFRTVSYSFPGPLITAAGRARAGRSPCPGSTVRGQCRHPRPRPPVSASPPTVHPLVRVKVMDACMGIECHLLHMDVRRVGDAGQPHPPAVPAARSQGFAVGAGTGMLRSLLRCTPRPALLRPGTVHCIQAVHYSEVRRWAWGLVGCWWVRRGRKPMSSPYCSLAVAAPPTAPTFGCFDLLRRLPPHPCSSLRARNVPPK